MSATEYATCPCCGKIAEAMRRLAVRSHQSQIPVPAEHPAFSLCEHCISLSSAAYDLAHGGYSRLWNIGPEPRRSAKQKIPAALRWEVFKRDSFACKHCGARDDLRADHIHPESRGGAMTLENLQTLCSRCNSKKGRKVA